MENQREPKDTKTSAEAATTMALSQEEWLERMMKKFDSDPEAQRLVDEIAALEEEEC